tara:strand:+ start:495 stop:671 length:177 start_codon:yes stop_codon:yes gene_type:complete
MHLAKINDYPQTAFRFVFSCEYFNDADEKTHMTDLLINLNQKKLPDTFENHSESFSAA